MLRGVYAVDVMKDRRRAVSSLAALLPPPLLCLSLPSKCAEGAVDAEAVCGLTTLTTLLGAG